MADAVERFRARPLAWIAGAVAAGIAAASIRPAAGGGEGALMLGLLAVAVALLVPATIRRSPPAFRVAAILCSAAILGCLLRVEADGRRSPRIPPDTFPTGVFSLEGSVHDFPRLSGGRTRFVLTRLTIEPEPHPAPRRVMVSFRGRLVPALSPGDRLRMRSRLYPPRNFGNPGEGDYAGDLAARRIDAVASPISSSNVVRLAEASMGKGPVERWRGRISRLIDRSASGEAEALLRGLLLGDRGRISEERRERWRRLGLSHLLAISGLHVGGVFYVAWLLLRRLTSRSRRLLVWGRVEGTAALCALVLAAAYAVVAGAAEPTRRAILMLAAAVGAGLLRRGVDPLHAVCGAGLVVLFTDPTAGGSVSTQLSFAAVASILLWLERRRMDPSDPERGRLSRIGRSALDSAAITVAAQVGCAPILLRAFHSIPLAAPIANPLLVPIVVLGVLPLGLASVFLAPFSETAASAALRCAAPVADFLLEASDVLARLRVPEIRLASPGVLLTSLYYASVAALFSPRFRRRRFLVAGLVLAWLGVAATGPVSRWIKPSLTATTLSVGQGDAHLLVFPNGRVALIDGGGGGGSGFDFGSRVVAPLLLSRGIRRIDYLVATHPESDHIGGFFSLFEKLRVEEVWYPAPALDAPLAKGLLGRARKRGARVRLLSRGDRVGGLGGAEVEVLHPPREGLPGAGPNDLSLVLRVSFGRLSILYTGDIEQRAEESILGARRSAGGRLRSTVLKVAHHGSRTSSGDCFLAAVSPLVALVSAGSRNRFGLPHADVLARFHDRGIVLFRTDRDGAVEVRSDGRSLRVITHARGVRRGFSIDPLRHGG